MTWVRSDPGEGFEAGVASRLVGRASLVAIRPYRDQDQSEVLALLGGAFRGWPRAAEGQDPTELFRWKHMANPFGRSVMMVAETGGAVIGFAAWLRWRVGANGHMFEVLRGVDVAVERSYRGQGVYSGLVREATARFPSTAAFTFSTPNQLSRAGSLRAGGQELGVFPLFVRVRAPVRSALRHVGREGAGSAGHGRPVVRAAPAHAALLDGERVSELLAQVEQSSSRFSTVKDLEYLAWRYGTLGAYRAMVEQRDGRIAGMAIFRVRRRRRSWVAVLCELLVAGGDGAVARRLLRRVVRAAAVDFVACHFPAGSLAWRAAIGCGFVPTRFGPAPTVRRLMDNVVPDPAERDSWAICMGDVDLL